LYSLADPVKQYPNVFGHFTFLAKYPYALPNIVIASLLLIVSFVGFLFMRETLESKKDAIRRARRPYDQSGQQATFLLMRPVMKKPQCPPFRDIFTRHVIINILVFSGLAMHTYTFDQLFSLLCSTEVRDGGLEMTPSQIGVALSISGVMAMALQFTLFPWGHKKFGEVFCLRIVLGMYCILYYVHTLFTST